MYQKPEPIIPDDYSGTALRREPEPENCPPPRGNGGQGDLLLLVLILLVAGEKEQTDVPLALILGALLLLGRGESGLFL